MFLIVVFDIIKFIINIDSIVLDVFYGGVTTGLLYIAIRERRRRHLSYLSKIKFSEFVNILITEGVHDHCLPFTYWLG
jgi:hypothetical protein